MGCTSSKRIEVAVDVYRPAPSSFSVFDVATIEALAEGGDALTIYTMRRPPTCPPPFSRSLKPLKMPLAPGTNGIEEIPLDQHPDKNRRRAQIAERQHIHVRDRLEREKEEKRRVREARPAERLREICPPGGETRCGVHNVTGRSAADVRGLQPGAAAAGDPPSGVRRAGRGAGRGVLERVEGVGGRRGGGAEVFVKGRYVGGWMERVGLKRDGEAEPDNEVGGWRGGGRKWVAGGVGGRGLCHVWSAGGAVRWWSGRRRRSVGFAMRMVWFSVLFVLLEDEDVIIS
ncbi:hypothetical protein Salat_1832800 [Sesamum alatum]|uniref:Uncharacterized protein n=1 Tax=Sesamum alatum TaxID=300844 RepID=A0AAE1Y3R1_9LAMI|nr:hypothetical protein Salat_1832800 [Sesamum alatum]